MNEHLKDAILNRSQDEGVLSPLQWLGGVFVPSLQQNHVRVIIQVPSDGV